MTPTNPATLPEENRVVQLPVGGNYSDADLIYGVRARDLAACAAFFDRFCAPVNRLVWRLLGDDNEHNDVVNNAFADMLTSIGTIRDPRSLPKWVSSVTVNAVRRELRNRKYRRWFTPLSHSDEEMNVPSSRRTEDIEGRVNAVLQTLPPDLRIVFVLRFIEGHSFEEVSRIRGCSLATAKRHGKKSRGEFMKKAQQDSILRSFVEGCEND